MAQLSDDCFAHGGALLRLDAALAELSKRLIPIAPVETLPLALCHGRILAEPLVAKVAVPPSDNSAVDGYAVYHDELSKDGDTRLPVIGRAAAGHPYPSLQPRGTAVRVLTGAVMPRGENGDPDTVMMQEDCTRDGDAVIVKPGIKRGANRRLAGEDLQAGETVLSAGCILAAPDLALAAAGGHAMLSIRRPLRVALISTGDEVHEPGSTLPDGGIYDANRPLLAALLASAGCRVSDLGIQPDRRDHLAKVFADAARDHDAVITSGGVSTGDEDHVKAAIEMQGRLDFWRLAIKPGRPVALGLIGGVPFFGLPGNPVAAMLTFCFFARPLLQLLNGASPRQPRSFPVTAGFSYKKKADRREWVRVSLQEDGKGGWRAEKYAVDGAGVLTSLTRTDGLIELPEDLLRLEPGETARFYPYDSLGL
ncbi:molybdopterin molybdotransferase MoeA [Ferrovibrio terrae]|uniref:Molybdopterin molybdenumtransferase n=1 Tax=Ferrovibrio terrae TaxID=2594003 RepID=A0A516H6Y3_9PROT|nr:gephyrin-like molybdotransferase Glp [Ferrovibrio terrae]QDO99485.1 molybdopterin molybdotransferase MoeA [Ferrovibrio terrae]